MSEPTFEFFAEIRNQLQVVAGLAELIAADDRCHPIPQQKARQIVQKVREIGRVLPGGDGPAHIAATASSRVTSDPSTPHLRK